MITTIYQNKVITIPKKFKYFYVSKEGMLFALVNKDDVLGDSEESLFKGNGFRHKRKISKVTDCIKYDIEVLLGFKAIMETDNLKVIVQYMEDNFIDYDFIYYYEANVGSITKDFKSKYLYRRYVNFLDKSYKVPVYAKYIWLDNNFDVRVSINKPYCEEDYYEVDGWSKVIKRENYFSVLCRKL